ncbi:MAG: OmpA family protein [Rhodobacteraceae bacterium]|nr:OmpA family protein [Paracoccaceae bacterium]
MRIATIRSKSLRSTTSLALCLALVMPVPGPAMAQGKDRCAVLEIQLGDTPSNRKERRCLRQLRKAAEDAGLEVPEMSEEEMAAEAEAEAAAQAEAKATAQAEAEAAAQAEAEAAAQAEAEAAAQAEAEAGEASVEVTEEELIDAEIEAAEDVDLLAEGETPAAAASEGGDTDATVQVETVTEGSARSSDEDFETSARGNQETRAQRRARDEGDSGLSDVEKVVLFGLGALAVGAILKNGAEVKSNSGDRVVVERDGQLFVLKDDDTLLRQPGSEVRTETFNDGSTRTTVQRPNGVQIVTIRTADGRVLRRTRILPDGRRVALIDDTVEAEPVRLEDIPTRRADPVFLDTSDQRALRAALMEADASEFRRGYSLAQIRQIRAVRDLVAPIDLDAINFDTGSAAIRPAEARDLIQLGELMLDLIDENPGEVFLIEGHTDATGSAAFNLALSDRRAESVALALSEFFDVPPENMVIQGYGESNLKVRTLDSEPANRRAVVRRITPLLQTARLR